MKKEMFEKLYKMQTDINKLAKVRKDILPKTENNYLAVKIETDRGIWTIDNSDLSEIGGALFTKKIIKAYKDTEFEIEQLIKYQLEED